MLSCWLSRRDPIYVSETETETRTWPETPLTRRWLPWGELSREMPRRGDIPRRGGVVVGGGGRRRSPSYRLHSLRVTHSASSSRPLTEPDCHGADTAEATRKHRAAPHYQRSENTGPSQVQSCLVPSQGTTVKYYLTFPFNNEITLLQTKSQSQGRWQICFILRTVGHCTQHFTLSQYRSQ